MDFTWASYKKWDSIDIDSEDSDEDFDSAQVIPKELQTSSLDEVDDFEQECEGAVGSSALTPPRKMTTRTEHLAQVVRLKDKLKRRLQLCDAKRLKKDRETQRQQRGPEKQNLAKEKDKTTIDLQAEDPQAHTLVSPQPEGRLEQNLSCPSTLRDEKDIQAAREMEAGDERGMSYGEVAGVKRKTRALRKAMAGIKHRQPLTFADEEILSPSEQQSVPKEISAPGEAVHCANALVGANGIVTRSTKPFSSSCESSSMFAGGVTGRMGLDDDSLIPDALRLEMDPRQAEGQATSRVEVPRPEAHLPQELHREQINEWSEQQSVPKEISAPGEAVHCANALVGANGIVTRSTKPFSSSCESSSMFAGGVTGRMGLDDSLIPDALRLEMDPRQAEGQATSRVEVPRPEAHLPQELHREQINEWYAEASATSAGMDALD
ncbi:hypothetical protein CYMTET_3044 [Cymbomonas tetramitiformis]|uniref:Uncharacterized protein n=1 Tax=Cymbomonas tetramitiformis TaxID=36881 RepID=A0AAE0H441_9CHLO|nr:hypothetical protein CYMTET_3044 [Cymbomonas tetramitiformis]